MRASTDGSPETEPRSKGPYEPSHRRQRVTVASTGMGVSVMGKSADEFVESYVAIMRGSSRT